MHFLMNLNRFSDKIRKRNCVLHDARLDRKQKNTTTFCSYYVFYFLPLNISNTVYNFTTLLSLFKVYVTMQQVQAVDYVYCAVTLISFEPKGKFVLKMETQCTLGTHNIKSSCPKSKKFLFVGQLMYTRSENCINYNALLEKLFFVLFIMGPKNVI